MQQNLQSQIKRLRVIVIVLVLLNVVILLSAFDVINTNANFEEINVERINIVEKNGKLRMAIANKGRLPNPTTNGRELYDAKGQRGPGIILFNDDGDEAGGYIFGNWGMHFSMDQFKQDQILYMQVINGNPGEPARTAGYWVSPQSASMTSDVIDQKLDSINAIADKSQRSLARANFQQTLESYNKAFMGKTRDDDTGLFLYDKNTMPRLRAYLDTAGNPRIDFLDAKGNVIATLPDLKH